MPLMRARLGPLMLLAATASLVGCGPIRSTTSLINAQQAQQEAEAAGAEELAPYYWTLARTHHEKAREEQMDAEYRDAFELGEQAKSYYEQARNAALSAQTIESEEVSESLEQEIMEQRRLREEEDGRPAQEEEEDIIIDPFEDLDDDLESGEEP